MSCTNGCRKCERHERRMTQERERATRRKGFKKRFRTMYRLTIFGLLIVAGSQFLQANYPDIAEHLPKQLTEIAYQHQQGEEH